MTTLRWSALVIALLLATSEIRAQRWVGPFPHSGGYSVGYAGGFRYTRIGSRSAFSIGLGVGSFYRGGYYGYGRPYIAPYGAVYNRVTVINLTPPQPQPIIVIQQPQLLAVPDELPPDIIPRNRLPEQLPVPDLPPAPKVPLVQPMPDKAKKEDAKPAPPKPRPEKEFPPRPGPEDDPRDEFARQIRLGRDAFVNGEYGRAAQRFRQAIRLNPAEPLPRFLLAQSYLSQGSYHEAFDAILAGLKRKPDWPTVPFRPQRLYGPHLDEYSDLLLALERTHARHPDDSVIQFLRGYVLWFDGRKEQATELFRKALKGVDREAVDRFLAALPDEAGL